MDEHKHKFHSQQDNIIVLEKGKVIESGKHKELMTKEGVYSNLVRMQTI